MTPTAAPSRLVAPAAAVLLGLSSVGVPAASLHGPLELRIAAAGALAALATGCSRTRWLSGVTCVAAVALVLLGSAAGRLSLPAAAVTGLLLLGYILLVDLAAQVERSTPTGSRMAGWGREQAPAVAAGLGALLAVTVALVVPWGPGSLVVVLAPALLAAGGMVALGHHR